MFRVKISVRNLVEFVLKSGDIVSGQGNGNLLERALEGARIHRRLQKEAGSSYHSEFFLSHEEEYKGILYQVEGRADGVFQTPDGYVVNEIKTTELSPERVTEDFEPLHWAQAICYGYFLALQMKLSHVYIRLTYYHTENGHIQHFIRRYDFQQLLSFYLHLLELYHPWAEFSRDWKSTLQESAAKIPFPFPEYRPGQREMAAAVYRSIRDKNRLFCQAPTGIGKTMSSVFPAVKAIGEGHCEKIFYLTARTTTKQTAWDAASLLCEKGLRMKSIVLTAKDKICPMEERKCNPLDCPRAAGHYDRVNEAVYNLLQEQDSISKEILEEYGEKYRVCPFELGLDLSLWCDMIICDYNYLFDPQASLKRFFGEKEKQNEYVFLIDEAHNLPDRARDMYSTFLRKTDILELRRKVKNDRFLKNHLTKLNAAMLTLRGECEEKEYTIYEYVPDSFRLAAEKFSYGCQEWLEDHKENPLREEVMELYFQVLFFLRLCELYDDHFVTTVTCSKTDTVIHIQCLDPSSVVNESLKKGRSTILFSATLSPVSYFQQVLGCKNSLIQQLPSPYPRENRSLYIADRISTKYQDRSRTLSDVAQLLADFVSGREGNYLLYFPSYRYMEEVLEEFRWLGPEVRILVQTPEMTEEEKTDFLTHFTESPSDTLVGFCVLGGIYSEGIDLKGERLIGTAIVGVGLPQVNREQELLRSYFEKTMGRGFEFAYQYPGMNKVLQAAGRVIRSETDRGVVLFIDSRFSQSSYRRLIPSHWEECRVLVRNEEEFKNALHSFWDPFEGCKNLS